MNATDTTEGGYYLSKMKTTYLAGALNAYNAFFGSAHLLEHYNIFVSQVTNGYPSGGSWYQTKVDLMNEPMFYGSYFHAPMNNGTTSMYKYEIDIAQLALYRLNTTLKNLYQIWLRDVVNATYFANMSAGASGKREATYQSGNVLPTALIY